MERPEKQIEFEVVKTLPTRGEIMVDIANLTQKILELLQAEGPENQDTILVCIGDFLTLFGSAVATRNAKALQLLIATGDELTRFLGPILLKGLGDKQ